MKPTLKRLGCLGCFLVVVGFVVLVYLKFSSCFEGGALKELKSFPFEPGPSYLAFSANGKLLAAAGEGQVRIWDVDTGLVRSLSPTPTSVNTLAFSGDGKYFAAGGGSVGEVILYDVDTLQEQARKKITESVITLAWSPDSKLLAVSCAREEEPKTGEKRTQGEIKLWEIPRLKEIGSFHLESSSSVVSFSPDGQTLAIADREKDVFTYKPDKVVLFDVATRKEKRTITTTQKHFVRNLAFTADGQTLAVLGDRLQMWNLVGGQEFAMPALPPYYLDGHFSLSTDGNLLAVSEWRQGSPMMGSLLIWDLGEKKERFRWEYDTGTLCHREPVPNRCLAFSPDGKMLAGGKGLNVVIYEVPPP